jgi:plasmid stabilization system protein ParE
MAEVRITGPARTDIDEAYVWWAVNRSPAQAGRWFSGILLAIESLGTDAERHPIAAETDRFPKLLREMMFGLQRRPTHRVLFTIEGATVSILRVRHVSQRSLRPDEL